MGTPNIPNSFGSSIFSSTSPIPLMMAGFFCKKKGMSDPRANASFFKIFSNISICIFLKLHTIDKR